MTELFQPLGHDTPFRFHCGPDVTCFNRCCRNLNQFLYPYDVIRMARALGLSAGEFLARYTHRHVGPETGLPVISLKPQMPGRRCPLVTAKGCRVYNDRPASCRLYPLARAVLRDPQTGSTEERFALIREDHCQGHCGGTQLDARRWIDNQGLSLYNCYNDPLLAVIAFKRHRHPQPLPPQVGDAIYDTLYLFADPPDVSDGKSTLEAIADRFTDFTEFEDRLSAAYEAVVEILKESAR
jgi:Fe-S-cluster containining protein